MRGFMAQAAVNATDRLMFTVFFAIAIHGALIFGIRFASKPASEIMPSLDITIVKHDSQKENNDADFLANANQEGSGTEDEAKKLQSNQESEFESNQINDVSKNPPIVTFHANPDYDLDIITAKQSTDKSKSADDTETAKIDNSAKETLVQPDAQKQLMTMYTELTEAQNRAANRPKVSRLTAVSTKSDDEAAYFYDWKKQIERVGNLNYPDQAKKQRLHGNVILAVFIKPNGQVKEIQISRPSGHRILDDAARRIAYDASPFKAFPPEIRKKTDIMEIITTFKFTVENRVEMDING